jgi:hypothetical protein
MITHLSSIWDHEIILNKVLEVSENSYLGLRSLDSPVEEGPLTYTAGVTGLGTGASPQ